MRKYNRKINSCDIEYCEILSIKDFAQCVEDGIFSNDDGCGYWAKDGYMSNDEVFNVQDPKDSTHIIWYNK